VAEETFCLKSAPGTNTVRELKGYFTLYNLFCPSVLDWYSELSLRFNSHFPDESGLATVY